MKGEWISYILTSLFIHLVGFIRLLGIPDPLRMLPVRCYLMTILEHQQISNNVQMLFLEALDVRNLSETR